MDVDSRLFTAVRNGRLETAREIIDSYGLSYSTYGENGYELLNAALLNGHADVAELLLSKGSEVESKNSAINCGNTPLHFAASNGDIKIVEMILSKNAQIDAKNEAGKTPLVLAIDTKATEAVELLLKHGADVNIIDSFGKSPLHCAIESRKQEIVIMLLSNGADVNSTEEYRSTPLHLAIRRNLENIVKMLLAKGANVNAKDADGSTPLHMAVITNRLETTTMLLTKGAIVNAKENDGTTPLHLAVQYSNPDIIQTILKFGADINSRDENRRTAFYLAFEMRYVEAVKILLEHGCDIDDVDYTVCEYMRYEYGVDDDYSDESFEFGKASDYDLVCERKVKKLFLHHIVKMLAANLYVGKHHLDLVDSKKNKLSDFHFECQKQITNMKSEKINNTKISLYNILAKTTSSLAIYMRNDNVVQVLKSGKYETQFPIYASMIKCNFQKGMERKELLDQGNNIFHRVIANVSLDCTEQIISYLSIKDIQNLIDAFKPLSISGPDFDYEVNISQP